MNTVKVYDESNENKLFGIIDNIDTSYDVFKSNTIAQLEYIEKEIKKTREMFATDGYDLFYTNDALNITIESFEETIKQITLKRGWNKKPDFDGSWFRINYQSRYKEKAIRIDRICKDYPHEIGIVNIVAETWKEAMIKAIDEISNF